MAVGEPGGVLRETGQRYRLLFERATDGIWLADQHGRFVDVNPALCEMLGYSREDHVRMSVADLLRPEDRDSRLGALRRGLARGQQLTEVWQIRRADGSYVALELSHAFTPDGLWQAIGRDVTEQRRVWAERERALRSEREIAEVLQHAILGPACLPAAFAVRYQPAIRALEVGGDWYDVITRPDGEFGVVLGDVVGHGVAAAATMGQLRSAARTLLVEGHGPGRVLAVLDTVAGLTPQARCATVFCAVITPQTGTVRYSSAGHPPAILDDPARGHRLLEDAQSVPLAVREAVERPETDTPLPAGSTLLCYTDGLIERRGESLDVGIAAAAGMLQTARGLAPAEVVERLTSGLVDPDHDDDVALLIYRQSAAALQATGKKAG